MKSNLIELILPVCIGPTVITLKLLLDYYRLEKSQEFLEIYSQSCDADATHVTSPAGFICSFIFRLLGQTDPIFKISRKRDFYEA